MVKFKINPDQDRDQEVLEDQEADPEVREGALDREVLWSL